MALQHEVTLHTGAAGLRLDAWDRYAVSLSMFTPGSPWSVTLFRSRRSEAAWDRVWKSLALGDRMFWAIDGAVQMNGRLEEIVDGADPQGGDTLTLSGRDLSGPALRWHADPRVRLKGLTLEDAMTRLFAPLGISVRVGEDVGGTRAVQVGTSRSARAGRSTTRRRHTLDRTRPQPGETVWQVADAIARRFGYMLWTAPHPEEGLSLVIDVPDYESEVLYELRRVYPAGRAPGDERLGSETNVLSSRRRVSIRDVPTEVTVCTGSGRGAALADRSTATTLNGALFDEKINGGFVVSEGLTQPAYIRAQRARGPAAAAQTAARAINDAMRGFRLYECTVQGHGQRQGDGSVLLYAVNTLARVLDEPRGIDERMLIHELTFKGSGEESGGAVTALTLGPRHAIQLTPEDP